MAPSKRQAHAAHTTIDTIFDRAYSPEVHELTRIPAGAAQLGRTRESVAKAWSVLNKWALEKLVAKGAIDIPNFARVGWQRFRRRDGEVGINVDGSCDNDRDSLHVLLYGRLCTMFIQHPCRVLTAQILHLSSVPYTHHHCCCN